MSNIFCGIGKIPKNKKRGSMKECAEAGQIRYYGIKKIDQKIIEDVERNKKLKKAGSGQVDNLRISLMGIMGKIKKLKGKIQTSKDKGEKTILEKELDELENKKKKLNLNIAKLEKKPKSQKSRQKSKQKSKSVRKKKSKRKTR